MFKIRNKYKYAIIGFCGLLIIAGSSYHGYRLGVTAGQEFDILIFSEFLKSHHKCIKASDLDCIERSNLLLLTIFNSKISALEEKGINRSNKEEIQKIKNWLEDTLAKKK